MYTPHITTRYGQAGWGASIREWRCWQVEQAYCDVSAGYPPFRGLEAALE